MSALAKFVSVAESLAFIMCYNHRHHCEQWWQDNKAVNCTKSCPRKNTSKIKLSNYSVQNTGTDISANQSAVVFVSCWLWKQRDMIYHTTRTSVRVGSVTVIKCSVYFAVLYGVSNTTAWIWSRNESDMHQTTPGRYICYIIAYRTATQYDRLLSS